ncbi:MAG: FAD-dependent oxidoreductase [Ignavibacteria bacterium]|jgi:glycine/D-amino acid oxidase-like deaminating enzyme/nitrite reductase/ring-hydroxylating ferredoxin subunit|nr:FAD-dependent oxidoreductase [Ignavibacteria bacterium]MCU7503746.1 FAD-dependent oxidoreductase [Ignavibacteria bacterium]MCU7517240.1 FAD-dependent oxidoreductase [Ignavibacteria bacterium]
MAKKIKGQNIESPLTKETEAPSSRKTSGRTLSYWVDSVKPAPFGKLDRNLKVDVVIVGAGISGLTTAYLLSREGKNVAVVEDGNIGSGESGRTTAHISNALDDRYSYITEILGMDKARMAAESHSQAIHIIEDIVQRENIDCDFERLKGYLFLHPSDNKKTLDDELNATQQLSIRTEMIEGVPGIPMETGPCLMFPDQATFNPIKYLDGLAAAIVRNEGKIFTNTRASKIDDSGILSENGFSIKADFIVVATNSPVNDKFAIHTKQAPYRTYVIAGLIKKGTLPHALWWDTGDQNSIWTNDPYHYVRLQNYNDEYELLIAGGEDHKTGQPNEEGLQEEDRYNNLIKWTYERFPVESIEYKWSGQVMEPVDAMAFIGKNPMDSDNVFIATGDSGNGMTHGTIAGILITDLIIGRHNPWEELYDPSRKTMKTAGDFIKENLNVAKQFKEYLTPGDVDSVKDLGPGQGAIIRSGLTKAAVYKDDEGKLFAYSAVCPHLKCILEWNGEEKTFDCPCHGSRFTCFGKVVNGPAPHDLEEIGITENGQSGSYDI